MAFTIKSIRDADRPRAYVTMIETDAQGGPIPGREWTEPFDTIQKDWDQLKQRFLTSITADDTLAAKTSAMIAEGNSAGLTNIGVTP